MSAYTRKCEVSVGDLVCVDLERMIVMHTTNPTKVLGRVSKVFPDTGEQFMKVEVQGLEPNDAIFSTWYARVLITRLPPCNRFENILRRIE